MNVDRKNSNASRSPNLRSANDEKFEFRLESVRRLEMNRGAVRIKRKGERGKFDELWHGDAYDPTRPEDQAISVYLRVGNDDAQVAELLCSCLARSIGLPVPEVFIVTVHPGDLRRSTRVKKNSPQLCVATRDLGGPTFAQLLSDDEDAAAQLLYRWPHLSHVVAFDEWIANTDRNVGNLIYSEKSIYIIDHAEAFGGQDCTVYPLKRRVDQMFPNRLGDMFNVLSTSRRDSFLREVHRWLADMASQINFHQVFEKSSLKNWKSDSENEELIEFLKNRLTFTYLLLCQRLGQPQLSL